MYFMNSNSLRIVIAFCFLFISIEFYGKNPSILHQNWLDTILGKKYKSNFI